MTEETCKMSIAIGLDYYPINPLEYAEDIILTYREDARTVLGNTPVSEDELNAMLNSGEYIAYPVMAYVHSGIALHLGITNGYPFNCPWDAGLSGYAMVKKSDVREWWGVKRITKRVQSKVENLMRGYLEEFQHYLNGYAYIIEIKCDGETEDWTNIFGDPTDELESLCKQYDIDWNDIEGIEDVF